MAVVGVVGVAKVFQVGETGPSLAAAYELPTPRSLDDFRTDLLQQRGVSVSYRMPSVLGPQCGPVSSARVPMSALWAWRTRRIYTGWTDKWA